MRRHLLPCTLAVVTLTGLTSATSAQPLPPAPPYNYCPESTQQLYVAAPRTGSPMLNEGMIAQVAQEWAVDRGLVLLHFETSLSTDQPEGQRHMRQALDRVIAALVTAGVPRREIYERPEPVGPRGTDQPDPVVFVRLPNRGTVCREDRRRRIGY